jgi:hypothetical protein
VVSEDYGDPGCRSGREDLGGFELAPTVRKLDIRRSVVVLPHRQPQPTVFLRAAGKRSRRCTVPSKKAQREVQ